MGRILMAVVAAVFLLADPASAATKRMTEKEKCLQSVTDVRDSIESEETPALIEKRRAEVESLLEISNHLCEQGNFRYAEELLELARGMVVSE